VSAEPPQDAATLAALEQEREQIEAGGIPLMAVKRLSELREAGGAFTSDLSVGGFALCHGLQLQPLAQVMGSSIYQVGYQGANWPMMMGGGWLSELTVLSEAWNEARRRALNRLELEARHAGADAVVGVQIRTASHDWAEGAIEYALLGTAVRAAGPKHAPPEQPVLTELSVSDYANLVNAGVQPLGIVAWTSVFLAIFESNWMLGMGSNPAYNYELPELTQGVYSAREQAMERLGQQARQHGASGIVGVRIGHTVRRQEVGAGGNRSRTGAVITFDVIGTAIREGDAVSPRAPQTNLDISN
jgi:uncharacterized protein YbjQ (UPF0145 family)